MFEAFMGAELILRLLCVRIHMLISQKESPIFFVSSPPFFSCLLGATAAKSFGIPYVWDVRDLYPDSLLSTGIVSSSAMTYKFLRNWTDWINRGAIVIFGATQGLVKSLALTQPNTMLARNGYDRDKFFPPQNPPQNERLKIVLHGLFSRMFDLESFLTIHEKLLAKNIPFEFVLFGSGNKLDELKKKNLPYVKILGLVSYDDVNQILQECDLGMAILPENFMSEHVFPVKVYEYIGSGLPTIMVSKGEAGELLVADEIGWQFGHSELKQVVECIEMCVKDRSQLRKIAANVQQIRDKYSRQKQSELVAIKLSEIKSPTAE